MVKLLGQPYPSEESPLRQWRKAAYIGLFVGLFLLMFQPFGLDRWETPGKTLKLAGFGLITFLVTGLHFTVWPRLFPRQFSNAHWTVGREIALVLTNILLIAIVNRLYLTWLLHDVTRVSSWPSMILLTFLIGLFPTVAAVLASYIVQLRRYTQLATDLPTHAPAPPMAGIPASVLTLTAENEKETLKLPPADLFYIESSDNYCTVVYRQNGQADKVLLRSSLSRLEGQINRPDIVRCHRSYVVNLDQVERVTGNAQGYKLHLANGQFTVPVARQYNESLVAQLKS